MLNMSDENLSSQVSLDTSEDEGQITPESIPTSLSPLLNLAAMMRKKAELSRTLADLEREIYAAEGEILPGTSLPSCMFVLDRSLSGADSS